MQRYVEPNLINEPIGWTVIFQADRLGYVCAHGFDLGRPAYNWKRVPFGSCTTRLFSAAQGAHRECRPRKKKPRYNSRPRLARWLSVANDTLDRCRLLF